MVAGCWLVVGRQSLVVVCRMVVARFCFLAIGQCLSVTPSGCCLFVGGCSCCWLLVVGCLVVVGSLSVVSSCLSVVGR